jgi:glycosyltransferase involved in cell wall biosynthesis
MSGQLRVLHLCTHDSRGGAAKCAYSLHRALRGKGWSSHMLVRGKGTHDPDVTEVPVSARRYRMGSLARRLPGRSRARASGDFNFDAQTVLDRRVFYRWPPGSFDIICAHLIDGLLTVRDLRAVMDYYGCPTLWTLMDQEPITGGCHYTLGCDGYERECGNCPRLTPSGPRDASRRLWQNKQRHLRDAPLGFACGGEAGVEMIRAGSLFSSHPAFVTPLGVDENLFRPIDPRWARDLLGVPQDRTVLLFGADMLADRRKGVDLLFDALARLQSRLEGEPDRRANLLLLSLGHGAEALRDSLPFEHVDLGYLRDELTVALAFQAADLFVCPSRQDEGPMMMPQSMMCGTPVVCFPTGYSRRLVRDGETGWVCRDRTAEGLAEGIARMLERIGTAGLRVAVRDLAVLEHSQGVFFGRYAGACRSMIDPGSRGHAQPGDAD